jgi:hypothetical protein
VSSVETMPKRARHHGRRHDRAGPSKDSTSSSSSSTSSTTSSSSGEQRRLRKVEKRLRAVENARSFGAHYGENDVIPIFDPQSTQSIDTWVHRVDELAKNYGWDDRSTTKLVASRLQGMARRWYDAQDHLGMNWRDMRTQLVKQFHKPLPFAKLLREAALYEAQPGQDLSEYCFLKMEKLKALNLTIPEDYLLDAVVGGITDENIQRSARSSRFADTAELYAYLSTLGCMPDHTKTTITPAAPKEAAKQTFTKTFANSSNTTTRAVQCFNCKGAHWVKDCPKPKIECFYCKRLGHFQNKCPFKTSKPKAKREINEIAKDSEKCKNPFVMPAVLNGKKVKCLVDTGSSTTIIRQCVAKTLGLSVREDIGRPVLRGFSGNRVASTGTVNIHVRVGEASARLRVVVVNDDQLMHDCIIGADFLNLPDVLLVKVEDKVSVRYLNQTKLLREPECFELQELDESAIHCGNVSPIDKRKCFDLLNEFNDRITTSMANLGKTNSAQLVIKCITDEPVIYHPYRLPEAEKKILQEIIDELLNNEIIRESNSPYASPILLVKKKTGDYRMCIDYRRLNAVTIKDKYPLPLIDEQLDRLGGNHYFTTLDLASGFYQVPVEEESIAKTAFVTPESHYEFLRMPFGLTNAPSVFQRLMNNVLGQLKNTVAFPYIDDIIIPSATVEEGLDRLCLVLEALRKHNLTIKLGKCNFFYTEISYLGREVSAEGIRPGQQKIHAVLQMSAPRTVKQVRQFIGLSSYFRKFLKDYARIVEPLTKLTRRDVKWQWKAEQEQAFQTVKEMLTSRPVLAIFDPHLPTELHTDASSTGLGAILLQEHNGKQRVVAYFSKQTTIDQRQYHSYELETMAVVYALKHFRVYLLGLHFTVVTDCNALRTTFSKKDLIPRVGRWWLEVQDYSFEIKYRPGTRMNHVDALSRYPTNDIEVNNVDLTESDWLVAAQLQDEQLLRIRQILQAKIVNSETRQYFGNYEVRNNKVYRVLGDGTKLWVVPKEARWQILRLCHDQAGHFGIEHTIRRIQLNYWFPKMRRFVTKYVKACLNCAYYKHSAGKKQGKLHPIEKLPIPFHTIHIDHVGPFETSKSGKKFLLVIVDAFTKFTIMEAVKSTKVKIVIRILQTVMCIFGVPSRIVSDRGSAFTSRTFSIFCKSYGIRHILNAVATPRANGQCERYNKTIVNMLATSSIEAESNLWDTHIKQLQSALNTSFNKSINTTPVKALFGYQTKTTAEAVLLNSLQSGVEQIDIDDLRGRIQCHITEDQRKQKEQYDKNRREADKYKTSDLVLVRITSEANTGTSKKLLPKYKGPFRVVRVLFNDRYEVEDLREGHRKGRLVVAVERMKPWITVQK